MGLNATYVLDLHIILFTDSNEDHKKHMIKDKLSRI